MVNQKSLIKVSGFLSCHFSLAAKLVLLSYRLIQNCEGPGGVKGHVSMMQKEIANSIKCMITEGSCL